MLKRPQRNNRRPRFEQMESRDLLAAHPCAPAAHCFTDRTEFETELNPAPGEILKDGYETGYETGDYDNQSGFDQFTDGAMSAVVGETTYQTTDPISIPLNLVLNPAPNILGGDAAYQNNTSFKLSFTTPTNTSPTGFIANLPTTSNGTPLVYGVGFDYVDERNASVSVTFADNSVLLETLPGDATASAFFGITSDTGIVSIEVTAPTGLGVFALDDLTLGSQAAPVIPATVTDISDAVTDLRNQGDIGNITAIVLLNRLRRANRALESGNEARAIRILERTNRLVQVGVFFGFVSVSDGADLTQLTTEVIDSLEAP